MGNRLAGEDLSDALAIESNLRQSLLKDSSAELICFYGHGEVDRLVGHGSQGSVPGLVIHTKSPGVRPTELAGRNVYAVACHAGAQLGPSLALAGWQPALAPVSQNI
jgi:hypothetical protein